MSSNPTKEPGEGQGGRRPRGLGGIILILALLLSLFLVVSSSGRDGQNSVHAFYGHLYNGRVESIALSDGVVTATVRTEGGLKQMEVLLRDFQRREGENEFEFIREMQPLRIDPSYATVGGSGRFLGDVRDGKVRVLRAFLVQELAGKSTTPALRPAGSDAPKEGTFLFALLLRDSALRYVRLEAPGPGEPSLQEVTDALAARAVPLRVQSMSLNPADFRVSEPNTTMVVVLSTVGPWLLVLVIVWFVILRQMRAPGGSGGVLSFGRSRASLYTKENRTNITFDDVAGMEEAKAEVREIIEFLKNPQKFARLGGSIPRGVLLVGSPGTGKTLLAKAIAGEAEVPFFSISGSDFVEMFVGVGASRVRDLFKQAREASPCIVFLDEIDAVGRKRGTGMGGGHDEREQTLNAILVEMDGFDSDKGIILVGATNRPDVLDPALLRPGRFDRQVVIDRPDVKGREAILKVHARKVKIAGYVDLHVIAKATAGFSGAELAAVINEAAILAAMKNKDAVDMADLEEARDRVRWGREKKSRAIEEEDKKVTAYHEAGHAVVSVLTPGLDPLHKVTIVSRGRALGVTLSLPEKDEYNYWRKKMRSQLAMFFGGRLAEELVFGDVSAGAQSDIEQATNLARVMVCDWGMSDRVGPIKYSADDENPFLGREFRLGGDVSERTREMIDDEVRKLIDEQYAAARKLLQDNRAKLDAVAQALLKHETISGDEVAAVMRGDDLEEYRLAQQRMQQQQPIQKRVENGAPGGVSASGQAVPAAGDKKPDVGLSGA